VDEFQFAVLDSLEMLKRRKSAPLGFFRDVETVAGTYLLYRILHDIANRDHITILPYSVHPVESLLLNHGIPVWFNKVHAASSREIDPKEYSV
jgi:hypothetical protein